MKELDFIPKKYDISEETAERIKKAWRDALDQRSVEHRRHVTGVLFRLGILTVITSGVVVALFSTGLIGLF